MSPFISDRLVRINWWLTWPVSSQICKQTCARVFANEQDNEENWRRGELERKMEYDNVEQTNVHNTVNLGGQVDSHAQDVSVCVCMCF